MPFKRAWPQMPLYQLSFLLRIKIVLIPSYSSLNSSSLQTFRSLHVSHCQSYPACQSCQTALPIHRIRPALRIRPSDALSHARCLHHAILSISCRNSVTPPCTRPALLQIPAGRIPLQKISFFLFICLSEHMRQPFYFSFLPARSLVLSPVRCLCPVQRPESLPSILTGIAAGLPPMLLPGIAPGLCIFCSQNWQTPSDYICYTENRLCCRAECVPVRRFPEEDP